jgi:predicted O-methyltransferase YrrM
MSSKTLSLPEPLSEYVLQVGVREAPVMRALRQETQQLSCGKMQSAPEQVQLLQFLVKLLGAQRYLEIGVFTGYSSLGVALALPEAGKVVACDMSTEFTDIAKRYWMQAGMMHKIEFHLQSGLAMVAQLIAEKASPFDLIFIDADKPSYPEYYEAALQLLRPGGVIALDNMFLQGRIIEPDNHANNVKVMRALNKKLHADTRVNMVMLPIGDGLTLVSKKACQY